MGKEFGEERFASDSSDMETKSCTEIDTDTSSSVDAEANENVVNLCDVLKEFMQRHPDACAEETDSLDAAVLDIEELRLSVRTTLEQAALNGTLRAAFSEAKPPKTEDAHVYPQTEIVVKRAEVTSDKACKDQRDVLSEARAAILAAAFDGRLAAAVEETIRERPEPSVDELRLTLKQTLSTSAADGLLTIAIEDTKNEMAQPPLLDIRQQIGETLLRAVDDGSLSAVLVETVPQQQKPSPDAEESLEDIRLLAQRTLLQANEDGGLQRAFKNLRAEIAKESILDTIKFKVKNILCDAATDGRLELALESVQKHQEDNSSALEDALRTVRQAFADAASDGRLEQALGQQAPEDSLFEASCTNMASGGLHILSDEVEETKELYGLDEMRSSVKQVLSEAATNGALSKALTEARACVDSAPEKMAGTTDKLSLDEMRGSVRQVLAEAVKNGALGNALADAKFGLQQPLQPVKPSVAQPLEYGLIMKLRSTFVRAASSGRLATVLEEVKKPEENALRDLRQRVKLLLSTSQQDGSLANILSRMGQSNPKLQMPSNAATDFGGTGEVTTGGSPISSSKRNRRIMGGIAREPAGGQPAPPSLVSPKPGKHSMVSAFRLDIYGGSASANPSVPLGYDDDVDDGLEIRPLRVPPGSKLRSNPHRPRTPKSLSSRPAMALDLEKQAHSSPSASRQPEFSTLSSQPLGSARVTKAAPKLPSVAGKGKVSYPICDLDLGLSARQWDVSRALF